MIEKRIAYPVPFSERNPDEWVVLASGPNNVGWLEYAIEHKANIFCVNGSIMLVDNPSAYVCLDPAAIDLFREYRESLSEETEKIVGDDELNDILGDLTIDNIKVRTIAIWAIYLACKMKKAKRIIVFGVHGANEKGQWSTLSKLEGQHNLTDWDTFLEYKKTFQELQVEKVSRIESPTGRPEHSNFNAATLIIKIRKMFSDIEIEIKGGGPVSDLVNNPAALEALEEKFADVVSEPIALNMFKPAPLIPFWQDEIKKKTVKPLWMLDYRKYKKSDTVFLLGSGPSVKDLGVDDFETISRHDSIGINLWPCHRFVPTFYQCESPDDKGILINAWNQKAHQYANVPVIVFDCMKETIPLEQVPAAMLRKFHIAETYFIPGDNQTKQPYHQSLKSMVDKGFFSPRERLRVISRRRASGSFNLSLALQMGYKNIVLVGFDLRNQDYFHDFDELKKPDEQYGSQNPSAGIPVSVILEAMVEAVAKPLGVKVFIGSEKSVLYPFLKRFNWEGK